MFFSLRLKAFVKRHPPRRDVSPAEPELLRAYEGRLPESLLELWRKHGLGFYGPQQLCLIDPRAWQAVLDRWIVSPPDEAQRIPIMLTPFGRIVYYRKLTASDEDVAFLDPYERRTSVLTWSLDEFFTDWLGSDETSHELLHPAWHAAALKEHGPLSVGEVYETDRMLLGMQMLATFNRDGLAMHQRLRNEVDAEAAARESASEPRASLSIREALPAPWRAGFEAEEEGIIEEERASATGTAAESWAGLYFTTHVDRHRLLALAPQGGYQLLFWTTDPSAAYQWPPRHYQGRYEVGRVGDGEPVIRLDIPLHDDSLGSDANDEELFPTRGDEGRMLLQACSLGSIAEGIHWNSRIRDDEGVLRRVRLDQLIPGYSDEGLVAPPMRDWPGALTRLVRLEPMRARIVAVGPMPGPEDEAACTVTVDLGEADGLRMSMPWASAAGAGKSLFGWVTELNEHSATVELQLDVDDQGHVADQPAVGDVLVSRRPEVGPLI